MDYEWEFGEPIDETNSGPAPEAPAAAPPTPQPAGTQAQQPVAPEWEFGEEIPEPKWEYGDAVDAPEPGPAPAKGTWLWEAPKAVASGAVETTGQVMRGLGAQRQGIMWERAREEARAKALASVGYQGVLAHRGIINPEEIAAMPPEKQKQLYDALKAANDSVPPPNITDDPFYKAGLATQQWSEDTFRAARDYENSWTRAIGNGLGSTIPFLATAAGGPMGLMIGMEMGATQGAGEALDNAIKAGATREQVMGALKYAAIPGLSDQVGAEALLSKIPMPAMGKFLTIAGKLAAKAAAEGGQEAAQQLLQNLITKYNYDPDKDMWEDVASSAGMGAIVGGIVAGAEPSTYRKEKQNDDAKPQTPPGVADTDTPPDAGTPGGETANTQPPPAGVGVPADNGVVVTKTGEVDPTIAAAASGVTEPTPQPTAATQETAAAPVDVTTPEEEVEDEYDWTEEEDLEGDVIDLTVEEPAVAARAREAEAQSPTVVPAGTDEAAALAATPKPKAQPTAAPVVPTPGPVTKPTLEIPNATKPAPEVPAAPVAEEAPDLQADRGSEVGAAEAQAAPDLTVPTGAPDLNIPGETAGAAPDLTLPETTQDEDQDLAAFVTGVEPVTAPAAEPVARSNAPVEEVAPQPELPHNLVSRSVADEVRTRMARDTISENPDFENTLDQAAREVSQGVDLKNTPAAKAIRDRVGQVMNMVRTRLEEAAMIAKQRQEEKITQAYQQHEEAVLTGPKQSRPRASRKTGQKPAEAIATESDFTTYERLTEKREQRKAKKEGREFTPTKQLTESEKRWVKEYEAKAKIKGGGEKQEAKRVTHREKMATERQSWVAEQKPRDVEKKEATKAKAEEREQQAAQVAEVAEHATDAEEAQRIAEAAAKRSKEIKARRDKAEPIVKKILDAIGLDYTQLTGEAKVRAFVQRVRSALKSQGVDLGATVDPLKYSAEENLAIFAHRLITNRDKYESGMSPDDVALGKFFLDNGMLRDFYKTLRTNYHGSTKQLTEKHLAKVDDIGSRKVPQARGSEMEVDDTFEYKDDNGQKHTIESVQAKSGHDAIELSRRLWPIKGPFAYFRRKHLERLQQMVGDVQVLWVTREQMIRHYGKDARGVFMHPNVAGMQGGEKGVVLINLDEYNRRDAEAAAHVIEHELTHAATSYAIMTNYRGTRDIVRSMMDRMKAQLIADGKKADRKFFKDEYEFVSESYNNPVFQQYLREYSMSTEMTEKLGIPSDRAPSWWAGVIAMVRHSLGLKPNNRGQRTYLDGVMRLHPDLMMSTEEQYFRANDDFLLGPDKPTREDEYGTPKWLGEALDIGDVKERLDASEAKGWLSGKLRPTREKFRTTEELKRKWAERIGDFKNRWENYRNPFQKKADFVLSRDTFLREQKAAGDNMAGELYEFSRKNQKEGEALTDLMFDASDAGVDPSVPPNHKNNKISKKGDRDRARRRAYAEMKPLYDALSPEAKALWKKLSDHYTAQENERIELTVGNIVDTALDKGDVKLPAGRTRDEVVEWVLDGGIDQPVNKMLPQELEMLKALGSTGQALRAMGVLRRIKGVYVPFVRRGEMFFTAREPIATPQGATRGDETKDTQTFIFKDKKAAEKFIDTTQHKVAGYGTRATDPKTGLSVDPKTGKRYTLKEAKAKGHVPYYHVEVIDKVMEMGDNEATLNKLRKQYEKLGYTTTKVSLSESALSSQTLDSILPTQVNRMLRHIDQSTDNSHMKKAKKAGVVDSYVRSLAGSRAQHRQLKRAGVKGYSRDLVNALLTANNSMAGHVANLKYMPQIAKADEELKAYMEDLRTGKDQTPIIPLQRIIQELNHRIDAAYSYKEGGGLQKLSNTALAVSYLTNLASPAFSIINQMQVAATTLPVLSTDFGPGASLVAMRRAMSDVNGLRAWGSGLKEMAAETIHMARSAPRILATGEGTTRGQPLSYHQRIVNILNAKNIKNKDAKLKAVEQMRQLGFGTDSGVDVADLSELHMNRFGKLLNRAVRSARTLPEAVESNNRYATAFAAIDLALASGMTQQQAIDYAVSTVEKTQGGYGAANNPSIMQTPYGKLAFQFKKYGLMYGQMYYGAALNAFNYSADSSPEVRSHARKQVLYLSAMGAIFAGIGGNAFMEFAKLGWTIFQLMSGGDEPFDDVTAGLEEALATVIGGDLSEIAMHGLSRAFNVDLQSRMGNDSTLIFGDPTSYSPQDMFLWLAPQFFGAPGGMIGNAFTALQEGKLDKLPIPKFMRDTLSAIGMAQEGKKSKSGATTYTQPTGWSKAEPYIKTLGFRPGSDARQFEAGGSGRANKAEQRAKKERTSTMQEWLNADKADRSRIWRDVIQPFNKGKSRKEKITMSDLLRNAKRRKTEERKRQREED